MLDPEKNQAPEAEPPLIKPSLLVLITTKGRHVASAIFGFLPELGLLLFMLSMPVIIVAYPAWRIADRLVEYSTAHTLDVKLTGIEVNVIDIGQDQTSAFEARKHFNIAFAFEDPQKHKYESRIEMAWPSPGLKGKLENQYQIGDNHTLYLLADQSIVMEEVVAKDSFYRLTALMGLAFIASALMYLMWKRLKHRMPANMPRFPVATEHSIMLAQFIALIVAGLWAGLMTVSPLVIQAWLFLAAYWGIVLLLSLSLRLLVFSDPEPSAESLDQVAGNRRDGVPDTRLSGSTNVPVGDDKRKADRDRRKT